MEKDTLITLDDNSMYVLLEDTIIDDKKYFYAVKMEEENPTNEYEVFEYEEEDGEIYLTPLDESELKESILLDFTTKYINSIIEEEE